MPRRKLLFIHFLFITLITHAQKNFSFTPEKPKPGDVITIYYEPAGDLAKTTFPIEAAVYQSGLSGQKADDIMLERKGQKYTGTVITDTAMCFLYFGFSANDKYDNNFNEGYYILLYENGQPKNGAYSHLANFYQYGGSRVGVERDNEKALEQMEKEFELYPDDRKKYLVSYVRLLTQVKKEESVKMVQTEIEHLLKAGLKEEADYINLEILYKIAKLPEQSKFVENAKKEKYPEGKWVINETIDKFFSEKDPGNKKQMLAHILAKIESDEDWSYLKNNTSYYKSQVAYIYKGKKDWMNFKKALDEAGITDMEELASIYNNSAWELQENSENLTLAEELSAKATNWAKEQWKNPTGKKPDYYTQKQWLKNNEYTYAQYADTYAMVMYRTGNYKKGFQYAKEAAINIHKGKYTDHNNTYALLAEKILPAKKLEKELGEFVKDGTSTAEIKEILKKLYVKNKKSEAGFDDYITALQKENYLKMLEELRKSIINETAPSFTLLDLEGKKVSLSDLKGKVVVVDFWATWCGPCRASFPGMQKMVTKYKDDPAVQFVFIDTWEGGDDKTKKVAEFIKNNNYTFHVLMDDENKVVEDYKVEGIPTKFVIDKKGMIRFKSIGFGGSDDKLISELTAMIEMAAGNDTDKRF